MKKLTVAGIGAGNYEGLTVAAVRALEQADVIVGYTVYCDLMKPYFPDKTWISTPMMKEIERCRLALETAEEGKNTVMICSGDAGIYGMASPILELAGEYGVDVDIAAGVTAASSGAALLGSPLTSDFAVVSLSDLLTPWETIEKRLEAAAAGEFVTVLYNPASKKRADYLEKAAEIFLKYRSPETVCGVAHNIGRTGEAAEILTLGELAKYAADMFTTVFIGNGSTKILGGKMVTPRGYRHE
ncbi:MAG: precorrin-3B C(17)-methyltransferase [Clostridia bacterium]|nr:precorrin-3B C(17)-methyltransferase [Clostridia bacterium]MBQ4193029.1 precorrin-3B C(17)-methyltransferase [Clostridia bacterium]MBQ4351082.1 precorrin-3B C(17)-methyltransferase [Clostridia bacterium]